MGYIQVSNKNICLTAAKLHGNADENLVRWFRQAAFFYPEERSRHWKR